jgi:hypothetical protein
MPPFLSAAKSVDDLADIEAVEPKVNLFAHAGHQSLARLAADGKNFL